MTMNDANAIRAHSQHFYDGGCAGCTRRKFYEDYKEMECTVTDSKRQYDANNADTNTDLDSIANAWNQVIFNIYFLIDNLILFATQLNA